MIFFHPLRTQTDMWKVDNLLLACVDGFPNHVRWVSLALGCVQATMAVGARRSTGQERCSLNILRPPTCWLVTRKHEGLEGKRHFGTRALPHLGSPRSVCWACLVILRGLREVTRFWHFFQIFYWIPHSTCWCVSNIYNRCFIQSFSKSLAEQFFAERKTGVYFLSCWDSSWCNLELIFFCAFFIVSSVLEKLRLLLIWLPLLPL